ncbi:tetratricopeptide repeat protein [Rapidithrix thailandica]|uniref:Tetratricopeptide repeat protein n=1 Tax=Rapidithrix thailandica TaxID=413964 RepID=A0AAW9RRE8_9BACT
MKKLLLVPSFILFSVLIVCGQTQQNKFETYFQTAIQHAKLTEYEKAIGYFEKALALQPDHYNSRENLMICATRLENSDLILKHGYYLMKNAYDEAWLYYVLQREEVKQNRLQHALKILKKGRKRHPENLDLISHSVKLYIQMENYPEAVELLEQKLQLSPRDKYAYCELGNLYEKLDKWKKAESNYQAALKLDPVFYEGLSAMASLYYKMGLQEVSQKQVYFAKAKPYFNKANAVKNNKVWMVGTLENFHE